MPAATQPVAHAREWTARGNDHIEVRGPAHVTAFDRCQITVYGSCAITAFDDCQVTVIAPGSAAETDADRACEERQSGRS